MLNWVKVLLQKLWGQRPNVVTPASQPKVRKPRNEVFGPHIGVANAYLIKDLLEGLPQYFHDLSLLRKVDHDAYEMFSALGGVISTRGSNHYSSMKWFNKSDLPGVACIFLANQGQKDSGERVFPRILYAIKMGGGQVCVSRDGTGVMLPEAGTSYRFVVVFELDGSPLAQSCFVHVDENMSVRCLPETRLTAQGVRSGGTFFRKELRTPRWIDTVIEDDRERAAKSGGRKPWANPDEYVGSMLAFAVSAKRPDRSILVRASKGSATAAWTISVNDGKRFFADRETQVTNDGRRKRILHYVGEFERIKGNSLQTVRAHYRGERSFSWNGYDIEVSGLGFHHEDFFAADIPQYEEGEGAKRSSKMISIEQASKMIRRRYSKVVTLGGRKAA